MQKRYGLGEAIPQRALDDLTALTAHICEVPIALISVVDANTHRFISKFGTQLTGTPREIAFCEHVIDRSDVFIVSDASRDERFAGNPLVTGEYQVRFYAGVALITPEGETLGTLSIVDHVPREMSPAEQERLRALGRQAMAQLELRRRSRELASRERLLASVFDHAPDCIKLVSPDGRIKVINAAALRVLEAESEEALQNRSAFSFVVPEQEAVVREFIRRAFQGHTGQRRFEVIGLKGGHRWLETHAAPFFDENGSVAAVLDVSRDITELVRAEEVRKELELRTEALVTALKEIVYDWRPPTNEMVWSGAYAEVLGYAPEEIGSTTESWSSRVHPDDLSAALREIDQVARERRSYDWEYRLRHRDGSYRWVHDRGVPTFSPEGKLTRMIGVMIEITARKESECELKRSEALFHTLASVAPIGIVRADQQGNCIYANERWCEISGLSAEATRRKGWTAAIHPDERDRIAQEWDRIVASGCSFSTECRFLTRDRQIRWVLAQAVSERSESGELVGWIGTFTEITTRKLAEEALRESQEHLLAIVESVDGIVWEADADTFRFRFVSRKAERLLGYPVSRWTEEPEFWIDHLHPDDKHGAVSCCRECTRQNLSHEFEYRMLAADGRAVWLRDLVTVVAENGKAVKLRGVMFDVTAQKLAEEMATSANQRYARQRAALTALTRSRVLQSLDLHAAIHEITEVAATTLEVERVGVWTFRSAHQSLVCLDLYEKSLNAHSSGLEVKREEYPAYFKAITEEDIVSASDALKDPRTVEFGPSYLEPLRIRAMMDASIRLGGSLTGVLCHEHTSGPRDWTPDEESFALSVANLISLVLAQAERNRVEEQLRQAQKLEAIGQLAGGVAHDFNNVLAVILMQTDLALIGENVTPEVKSTFEEIRAAADRAANLTRQLLLFSRRQVMQPREVDLNEVVTSIAKMLRRLIGEDIQLELHLHSSSLMIRADPGMLDQVLLNLAVNSRDAMPNGGRLRIDTQLQVVDRELARLHPDAVEGSYVCLTVSDSGVGIAPGVLPRIFEPFFTTKGTGKGTGLGLATVFGIVKQHDGWIQVASEPGKGTKFQIFLPSAARAASAEAPAGEGTVRGGSETILLAEDDSGVRRLTRLVLQRHGYTVVEAANGAEALKLWKEQGRNVHLLVTDVVMPGGVSGHDLARSLRADRPDLKVIFMSGYSPEIAGQELESRPGEIFLQKPCSRWELLLSVRRLLDGG